MATRAAEGQGARRSARFDFAAHGMDVVYWRARISRQSVMAAASSSSFSNVVPFPRPFRAAAAAAPHKSGRAAGNAALLSVGVAIVVAGVFLLQGITSIPRHVDCNFSKHRPCHSFVGN